MADQIQQQSRGGQFATSIAVNTAGVITNTPGRICSLVFLSNFANTMSVAIYDNSTGAGGMIIYNTLDNTAKGTKVDLDIPLANGAYWGGGTNTPPVLITYTKDSTYGR